jgi:transposase
MRTKTCCRIENRFFLRKFLQYQNSSENIIFVYLDETWVYQNGSNIRRWVHEKGIKSNLSKIKSEGKRFTILHAGCRFGFLGGCDLLLDAANNDRDYHKTMNVISQLIPGLAKLSYKCVVIMDNAPYHSMQFEKLPTSCSTKAKMQERLINHHVQFEANYAKNQLWEVITPFGRNCQKQYLVDKILNDHGHEILRLPPYHCQYNPFELAWGLSKNYYNKHINEQPSSRNKVADLWSESLLKCTPEIWQNYCTHCEELIASDWTKHMGNFPPFIISLADSDSESESDFYNSD